MKRFILGVIFGAILFVPIGAKAWSRQQMSQPIYGVGCMQTTYEEEQKGCDFTVSVFDDSDNKCYVAINSSASYYNSPAISCLKTAK